MLAVLLVTLGGVALANGGPHGSFTAVTDGCAGCHRAHTAQLPKLLSDANYDLCISCHGTGATGSDVNVVDGIYEGTAYGTQNAGLNGGGFVNVKQDTTLTGTVTSAVTSIHSAQGTSTYTNTATLWGSGDITTTTYAGAAFDLYCTSCHDPHGNNNYRMIKTLVNMVPVTLPQTDESVKSYTATKYYTGTTQWTVSDFCAACHKRYDVSTGASGETDSGDAIFKYRHRIDAPSGSVLNGITYTFPSGINLPLSTTDGQAPQTSPDNRSMVCLTCHYAHGTKATMGTYSGAVAWPNGATSPSGNNRSSLLRLDNRGVCENCHAK